jgi:hypothetical protein
MLKHAVSFIEISFLERKLNHPLTPNIKKKACFGCFFVIATNEIGGEK